MSDARERVAEAICSTTSAGKLFPWSESNESAREPWRRMADAAIAAHLVELGQGGYVVVKLPESPSEYWGAAHQPQWNHYPFTRVDGDQVEIGARSEHVFRINVTEARVFAADVLAAAGTAEAQARCHSCGRPAREGILCDECDPL